ncbi:MAG: GNAT family N-acetyltransferase [Defluviitaleaceae bacterium]|nr:GNAT family N-acetyltransferase [Defluviitaleaceae bacterium]
MLQNGNIILRYIKESDAKDYSNWIYVENEWMDWDAPWEKDEDLGELLKHYADVKEEPKIYSRLQIDTLDEQHIGSVNSYYINGDKSKLAVGIGIYSVSTRNKGYGAYALSLWMAYVFKNRDIDIIYTQTWSGNLPMVRLAEKVGFVESNRLINDREVRGLKYDALEFSITREDFFTKYPHLKL